jgi:hypothetical protein
MHCPCPDTTKLERWVSAKHSTIGAADGSSKCDALVKAVEGFVACPRIEAVDLFLAARGKRFLRKGVKLIEDKLKSVDLVSKEELFPNKKKVEAEEEEQSSSLKYVVKLQLKSDSSSLLFAENVVLADTGTCVGRANIPSFLGRISLASQALSGGDDQQDEIGAWTERIAFAESDLDLTTCDISDKVVCIVGGGMTSIHLAEQALGRLGAKQVYLISKSKMDRVKKLQVDIGWMGGKYMRQYLTLSPQERLESYQESRGRGSISHQAKEALDSLARNSKFKLMTESMVSTAAWHCDAWKIDLVCATHAEGISADYIWVATGTSFDCMSEPVVQDLQKISKAKQCGAYPLLSENTLAWPGIPNVFCMGSIAALSVGPSAMLCHGLRTASARITSAILNPSATLNFDLVLEESKPISMSSLCEGEGPSAIPTKNQLAKPSLQPLSEIQQRLNAVVSDPCSPSKKKYGIENYTWSDSEFDIDIYVKVGLAVEKRNVQVIITPQSVELLVETRDELYHLKIPKLYKPVQTTKSNYRVLEAKGKVIIHLKKTDNHEWKFLRG